MCKSLRNLLFCSLLLLSPLVYAEGTSSSGAEVKTTIASMRADLQLLSISIANYEQKISDLKTLISQSQEDLTAQKQSLTNSETKLSELKTQYGALNSIYQSLSARYKRSTKIIKYGGLTTLVIIATESLILYLK